MAVCPRCGQPLRIHRGEIGAIATDICDPCYYERFAGQPSEARYFAEAPEFWRKIEAEIK